MRSQLHCLALAEDSKSLLIRIRTGGILYFLKKINNLMHRVSKESIFTPYSGFRIFLGQPSEFPLLQSDHLLLAPGLGHSIRVSATHVSTDTKDADPG